MSVKLFYNSINREKAEVNIELFTDNFINYCFKDLFNMKTLYFSFLLSTYI